MEQDSECVASAQDLNLYKVTLQYKYSYIESTESEIEYREYV